VGQKHNASKCNTTIGLESSDADIKFYSPTILKGKLGKSVPVFVFVHRSSVLLS